MVLQVDGFEVQVCVSAGLALRWQNGDRAIEVVVVDDEERRAIDGEPPETAPAAVYPCNERDHRCVVLVNRLDQPEPKRSRLDVLADPLGYALGEVDIAALCVG